MSKMQNDAVTTLSDGWRMKLALARAMLQKADVLLLDESTNHLDVINVAWVEQYLISLKNVTSIIASHNAGLLDKCCTHILSIDRLKLDLFKGNLTAYVTSRRTPMPSRSSSSSPTSSSSASCSPASCTASRARARRR
jgi:elongation factor 3